jgi:hypothetical protein
MKHIAALMLITTACAERESGLSVNIGFRVSSNPEVLAQFNVASLNITNVTLTECARTAGRFRWSLISSAYAHGSDAPDSPFVIDEPIALNLQEPGPVTLASFSVPPSSICSVEMILAPTDSSRPTLLLKGPTVDLRSSKQLVLDFRFPATQLAQASPNLDLELELEVRPPAPTAEETLTQLTSGLQLLKLK